MTLPSKIKKAIHRKKAIRISLFLLTVLLMTVAIIILENSDFNLFENNITYKYLIYIVLLVSSFFITKAYLVFTDTNYCGEVKKVNIKSVVDSKSSAKPTWEQLYRKNEIYITIEDETGRIFRKKACEFPSSLSTNLEMYKVGDKVLHLHGTDITIVLPTATDKHCRCAMCGWSNDKSNDNCSHCGFPLIKSI